MAQIVEKIHIGIDVSKEKLDIYIHEHKEYYQISNDSKAIKHFFGKYRQNISLVVFEHTGVYSWVCADTLSHLQIDYHMAHPLRVKSYIRGLGVLAKTDRIDAVALARYATEPYVRKNAISMGKKRKLHCLASYRNRLVSHIEAQKNCFRQFATTIGNKGFVKVIKVLEQEKERVQQDMLDLIASDTQMSKVFNAITGINSVGKVTAAALIALVPELGTMNRNQVAALVGVAPINRDSGTKSGYRFTRGGRSMARKALYMAALVAAFKNSHLKAFYQKLLQKGKLKKQALTAVMRKLLNHINATAKLALIN